MKYILTITLCSLVDNVCLPPHSFPQLYNDLYTCQIDGYSKAIEKIEEIGINEINKHKIYTSFRCEVYNTI